MNAPVDAALPPWAEVETWLDRTLDLPPAQRAAWLAAQTPDGPAPTSASRIAEAIPQATARLTGRR